MRNGGCIPSSPLFFLLDEIKIRFMKLTSIVFCLALLGGALTSCIDEDIDDCFSINRLTLSYKGDGTTEIFPDKNCRVEMYVFDPENK